MSECPVAGCEAASHTKGMCRPHYRRNLTYGDPLRSAKRPLEERFWSYVEKGEGCWLWTGATSGHGYGRIFVGGRRTYKGAHRVSYEMHVGPIAEGMQIDHMCHVRNCVNPDHLRQATQKENRENLAGAHANSETGVRGVTWDPRRSKYFATTTHNRENYFVGRFATLAEAEAAVIAKRNELFTHNDADRVA